MKKILAIVCTVFILGAPSVSAAGGSANSTATLIPSSTSENSVQLLGVPFQPDRCIVIKRVIRTTEFGFTVEAMGGTTYYLSFKTKVGWNSNVKAGSNIDIMVGSYNKVYGWKIV